MVKAILVSAALAAASIASVAQAASLKQDPLFGCEVQYTDVLGLGIPDDSGAITSDTVPAGFVAGRTGKSKITGKSKNSALSTTRPSGAEVAQQTFAFVNCTQSLLDQGYELNVPKSLSSLNVDGLQYVYSWGVLRAQDSLKYSLSPKSAQDSKGRLDSVPLLHTKVADTKVEYRTFILATADEGANSFLEYYTFAGTADAPKAGEFFAASDKWGSVEIATNFTAHAGTGFLTLGAIPTADDSTDDTTEEQ